MAQALRSIVTPCAGSAQWRQSGQVMAELRTAGRVHLRGKSGVGRMCWKAHCVAGEEYRVGEGGNAGVQEPEKRMTPAMAPRKEGVDMRGHEEEEEEEEDGEEAVLLHPSWLLTILGSADGDGGCEMERIERPLVRGEDSGWSYAPELPRGLMGRQFGGVAMASSMVGLGLLLLAGTEAAQAAGDVSWRSQVALGCDMRQVALGPEGPLLEDFWDNMRRYGLYFLTVASGGLYSLVQPLLDLLKSPVTAFLVLTVLGGSLYLVYLTLSTMLGITQFDYAYSS